MTDTAQLVTGVDFVCIPTTDFDRARAFYDDVLGLPRRQQWGTMPAQEYQADNLTLVVWDPTAFGQERPTGAANAIALQVDDVEAARATLTERGVTFAVDTIDSGVCHMAFFHDPDGNPLLLHHRYAPTPGT